MLMKIEGIEYDYSGDVFIDIGGNIGMWTTLIGSYYTKILFIEPSQIAMVKAKENITKANLIDRVTFIKKICSNIDGEKKSITASCQDSGNFSVFGKELYDQANIVLSEDNIETMTLDSLIDGIEPGSRVTVKIDTEGSELNVLLGAKEFIKKFRPVIVLETHYHMHYDAKKEKEILGFLNNENYSIRESKMLDYKNNPGRIYDGKHNGEQMYNMHYHMLLDPNNRL